MKYVSFKGQLIVFASSFLVAAVGMTVFGLQERSRASELVGKSFEISAKQLADAIGFSVKTSDLAAIEMIASRSFISESADFYRILDLNSLPIFQKNVEGAGLAVSLRELCGTRASGVLSITYANAAVGQIEYCYNSHSSIATGWFLAMPFFVLLISGVLTVLNLGILKLLLKQIWQFLSTLEKLDPLNPVLLRPNGGQVHPAVNQVYEQVGHLISRINHLAEEREKSKIVVALGEVASQVAHDVRSPLSALEMMLGRIAQLPEQDRLIIRGAVNRIKDIAQNLLDQNRQANAKKGVTLPVVISDSKEPQSTVLLSSLIEPLVTEKRMQFRSKIGVQIEATLDAGSYGLFGSVQPTEFKRVVSNLVNNAVEVLPDNGMVSISMRRSSNGTDIIVRDNGRGIPSDTLAKLGNRGETHGKAGGSGLGLYHARTSVESWGGRLMIESKVGAGTAVTISLPTAQSPSWFVSILELSAGSSVVIVDDDASIHQIWQGRLDSFGVAKNQISIVHLSTPDQLRNWVGDQTDQLRRTLYLVDFELLGFRESGLDLINELNLGHQSVLVTSRFEEQHIRERCQKLNVKLIPKGLAGFVPIGLVKPRIKLDAILVDDDSLVKMTWEMAARLNGKTMVHLFDALGFFSRASEFDLRSPVYIDSSLGNDVKGEWVAKEISDLGFESVFLATGHEPSQFRPMPWIKEIVGKDPPWHAVG